MADGPPPIDDLPQKESEEQQEDSIKEVEATHEISLNEDDVEKQDEQPGQVSSKTVESDDLFGEDPPSKPEPTEQTRPHTDSEPPTLEADPVPVQQPTPVEPTVDQSKPTSNDNDNDDLFGGDDQEEEPKSKADTGTSSQQPLEQLQQEEDEDDDDDDTVDVTDLIITVSQPEKVGDGMGAYLTYLVTTKTTLSCFKNPEVFVRRRFSDFLGLYFQLVEKYTQLGRIVPPAPEKSVSGMTKVKFSKSEESGTAFIERRRANLERYLGRLARHPAIRKDEILINFLENAGELPKAKQTAAMSGAGFMRLVKNVGDSISKVTGKKSDSDVWFEDRQTEYEVLEHHLKKLHNAVENMIGSRKDLCSSTGAFVKSVSTLANVEENNSVSRALTRLSEVEEKVEALHQEQSNNDLYIFGETIRDYIMLINSIKETFNQRVKVHSSWLTAQKTLQNKREQETKLTTSGKVDKIPLIQDEIHDWEKKEKDTQKAFDKCSKVLKREIERFESERSVEFKQRFIEHLEGLMKMEEELIRVWEEYLPDAQAIEVEA